MLEKPKSLENQINSSCGLRYDINQQKSHLNIPKEIIEKIGGRDVVARNLFPKIFDGSHPLWAQMYDLWYSVEITQDTPLEKVQLLIDEIENLYKQKNKV